MEDELRTSSRSISQVEMSFNEVILNHTIRK